jgi:phosphatidylinositol alpha-1,6-mannosyltransferase
VPIGNLHELAISNLQLGNSKLDIRHSKLPVSTLVLTPNLTGDDGISRLSRLIVRAFDDVSVLALHEPPSCTRFEHAPVQSAGGSTTRFAALTVQLAARQHPDTTVIVVHIHLAPAALALTARGASLVTCLCGIEAWTPLSWPQRAAIQQSRRLIAISHYTIERFRLANPRAGDRPIDVCHPGIELAASPESTFRAAAAVSRGTPPSALIVGRMSAEERYKGHDRLLEIWPQVVSEFKSARLEIVGDGDDRPRLAQKSEEMGLASSVTFHGRVSKEQLCRHYERCAVFVMPSRNEGFGLVFLEAMRARRACIGATGAASEIIDDGRTGLLVPPGSTTKLTDALVTLLRNQSVAASMGEQGRARFLAHFTEERFRSRLHAVVPQSEKTFA